MAFTDIFSTGFAGVFDWWKVIQWGAVGNVATSIFSNMLVFGFLAVILYILVIRKFMYPIRVDILNKTGGGGTRSEDERARIKINKDNTRQFKFMKYKHRNAIIDNPDPESVVQHAMGKQGKIYVAKLSDGMFQVLNMKDTWENSPLEFVDTPTMNSFLMNYGSIEKKYENKDWLQKYGNYLILIVLVVFGFLGFQAMLKQAGTFSQAIVQAGNSIKDGLVIFSQNMGTVPPAS